MFHFRGNKDTTDVTFWSNFESKSTKKNFMSCLDLRPLYFTLYFCDWIFAFPKTITLSDCGLLASKSSLRSSNSPPRAIKVTFDALEPSSRPLSWIFHYLSPIKLDFREFQKISGDYENLRNLRSCQKIYKRQIGVNRSQLKLFSGDSRVMKLLKWGIKWYWDHFWQISGTRILTFTKEP